MQNKKTSLISLFVQFFLKQTTTLVKKSLISNFLFVSFVEIKDTNKIICIFYYNKNTNKFYLYLLIKQKITNNTLFVLFIKQTIQNIIYLYRLFKSYLCCLQTIRVI